jgi:hypothetical protein
MNDRSELTLWQEKIQQLADVFDSALAEFDEKEHDDWLSTAFCLVAHRCSEALWR